MELSAEAQFITYDAGYFYISGILDLQVRITHYTI